MSKPRRSRSISETRLGKFEQLERRQMLSLATSFVGPVQPTIKATTAAVTSPAASVIIPATDLSKRKATDGARAYTQYQLLPTTPKKGETYQPFATNPPGSARTPAQIRKSYNIDTLVWGAVTGDGTGQTIAIVDAYDDPSFVSDTDPNYLISDLAQFDAHFGLANPPSFKKFNGTGGTTYPAYNSGWAGEIALDVEWTHAMAPGASIILVEAGSSLTTALNTAVNTAKNMAGVTAVSMSWGGGETSAESIYSKTGVTFFASSGDSGGVLSYPSSSQNVVGVGGTHLNQSSSAGGWLSESGWSGSGGGTSSLYSKPDYQSLVTTPSATKRTAPDVAADADPATGVAVLDSSATVAASGFNADHVTPPASPWFSGSIGGTSLSSPLWAGFMADVNQGRALMGLGSLSGRTETLPRIYELAQTDFHDITSGTAGGFSAGAGYDQVTGRGTIKTGLLQDLAGGAKVSGKAFIDKNGNAVFDGNDVGMSGITVFGDINGNGTLDTGIGERTATTDGSGNYTLSDYVGGISITVRATSAAGYFATTSLTPVSAMAYNTTNTVGFGFFPNSLTGSAFTLKLSGTTEQIYTTPTATGTPEYAPPLALLSSGYTLNATGGSDVLNIDLSGTGVPIPAGSITYANTAASDAVVVTGSDNGDTVSLANSDVTFGALAVHYGAAGTVNLNTGSGDDTISWDGASTTASVVLGGSGGNDTLNILSGTWAFNSDAKAVLNDNLSVNVANGATAVFNSSQHLASISVAGSGVATATAGGDKVIVTKSLDLSGGGSVDLNDNDMVIDFSSTGISPLSDVIGWIAGARNGGAWDQNGLTSTAAKNAVGHHTTLGAMDTNDYYAARGNGAAFSGETTNNQEVVIKYTYYGDANFNGKVDGADYARIDANFNAEHSAGNIGGWFNGDFSYDGRSNGTDYSFIDAAFNSQLGVL